MIVSLTYGVWVRPKFQPASKRCESVTISQLLSLLDINIGKHLLVKKWFECRLFN